MASAPDIMPSSPEDDDELKSLIRQMEEQKELIQAQSILLSGMEGRVVALESSCHLKELSDAFAPRPTHDALSERSHVADKDAASKGDDDEKYPPVDELRPQLNEDTSTMMCSTSHTYAVDGTDASDQESSRRAPTTRRDSGRPGLSSFFSRLFFPSVRQDQLSKTIYSLLYISPLSSLTFWYAAFVFVLQAGMIVLVLLDQITPGSKNPFSIPAGVSPLVSASQAACLLVAVALQQDLTQAVKSLQAGHDDKLVAERCCLPAATLPKFLLANLSQLLLGGLQLVATFALVVSSSTVIEVFLNFAGLGFISEVDDVGFQLADHGIIHRSVRAYSKQAQKVKVQVAKTFVFPRLCYLSAFCLLMGGYAVTLYHQFTGYFLCKKIFVQFGDNIRLEYGGFSGEYILQEPEKWFSGRASYLEIESEGKAGRSMLAYCDELAAWTHSSWNVTNDELPDPCKNWKAKSGGETAAYDVLDTSDSAWVVVSDSTGVLGPFEGFYLTCNDCSPLKNCKEEHGVCNQNECVCHSGRFGMNCVFEQPCKKIQRDARTQDFAYSDDVLFELMRDGDREIFMYRKHPIYVHQDFEGVFYFKVFTGRRWAYMFDQQLESEQQLLAFLQHDFHVAYTTFDANQAFVVRVSDPVDFGTRSYQISPVGLRWHKLKPFPIFRDIEDGTDEPAVYVCAVCDEVTNPCQNIHDEACGFAGGCQCRPGYRGALCEAAVPCSEEFPCQNTGTCAENGVCVCNAKLETFSHRFYGEFCEFDSLEGLDYEFAIRGGKQGSECGCRSLLEVDYRGTTQESESGLRCEPWGASLEAIGYLAEDFLGAGLEANYCRNLLLNPSGASCFVNGSHVETCNVPECDDNLCPNLNETCGCKSNNQTDYRGNVNLTVSGRKCQAWEKQSHGEITPERYPEADLDQNYCRNPVPDVMEGAWCYTEDPDDEMYELCDIPVCPFTMCPDEE